MYTCLKRIAQKYCFYQVFLFYCLLFSAFLIFFHMICWGKKEYFDFDIEEEMEQAGL